MYWSNVLMQKIDSGFVASFDDVGRTIKVTRQQPPPGRIKMRDVENGHVEGELDRIVPMPLTNVAKTS